MKSLLKLHWQFLKFPSYCLDNYIPNWPVRLGLAIYIFFFLYFEFSDPATSKPLGYLNIIMFGNLSTISLSLIHILEIFIGIAIAFYVLPVYLRLISPITKEEFNIELCRKLILFSPTAAVIYMIIFMLPIKLVQSLFLTENDSNRLLYLSLSLIITIFGLWLAVLMINFLIVYWKGLAKYFKLSNLRIFLFAILLPTIISLIPYLIYSTELTEFYKQKILSP